MLRTMCRAKIHRAVVTDAQLEYAGSITIDRALMQAAGILPQERVQVLNHSNGERIETYVIAGEAGSGVICLNGPAARLGQVGDLVSILSYALVEEDEARGWEMSVVYVDGRNRIATGTEAKG